MQTRKKHTQGKQKQDLAGFPGSNDEPKRAEDIITRDHLLRRNWKITGERKYNKKWALPTHNGDSLLETAEKK